MLSKRYYKKNITVLVFLLAGLVSFFKSSAQCTPYKKSVVISTSTGDIDLANVDGNSITVTKTLNFGNYVWGDVAVAKNGDVYVVDFSNGNLFKTNFTNGGLTFVMNISRDSVSAPNSLMFLPDGTLLVGNGRDSSGTSTAPSTLARQSSIYRLDLTTKALSLWHSFGGQSITSGDFANYNGDIYVAWSKNYNSLDTSSYLYKVKVDNDYNFVSYTTTGKENTSCLGTNPPYGITNICGSGILAARNSVIAYLDVTDPTKCTPITFTGIVGDIYGLASFADVNPSLCDLQDCSLPVSFGKVTATITNNNLMVNWQTLTETNNDHFDVEVSKDGQTFTKAGTVISQAKDGTSSQSIQYSFARNLNNYNYAAISLLVLGGLLSFVIKRKKAIGYAAVTIGLAMFAIGCTKSDANVTNSSIKNLYVRIVQVDKDGKSSNSTTVQAVQQ